MSLQQTDKVRRRITSQRRLLKVWVAANEVFRLAVEISEIAASASGNQNFLPGTFASLQHRNFAPALPGLDGAHQPRSAGPQNQSVKVVNYFFCQAASRFRGLLCVFTPLLVCSRLNYSPENTESFASHH